MQQARAPAHFDVEAQDILYYFAERINFPQSYLTFCIISEHGVILNASHFFLEGTGQSVRV